MTRWLPLVLWTLMMALSLWAWIHIPEGTLVPIHWNLAGEPDGWGHPSTALGIGPGITILLWTVLHLARRLDPRQRHVDQSRQALDAIVLMLTAFLAIVHGAMVASTMGVHVEMNRLLFTSMGLLFAALGNFLSKLRSNYFAGIRTPWTLSSERSWARTHRLGGRLFVLVGLGTAGLGAMGWPILAVAYLLISLLLTTIYTTYYSYQVWKDDTLTKRSVAPSSHEPLDHPKA